MTVKQDEPEDLGGRSEDAARAASSAYYGSDYYDSLTPLGRAAWRSVADAVITVVKDADDEARLAAQQSRARQLLEHSRQRQTMTRAEREADSKAASWR